MKNRLAIREARRPLRREICAWQQAAAGIFALSLLWSLGQTAWNARLSAALRETETRLEQAERTRDYALEKLGALSLQAEEAERARAEQAAAFEAAGKYAYVGPCTITAYCPCEACCGVWADGLTASGLPAEPGIAAVDPAVIPLGSVLVIDGRQYLAADTGVSGYHVDLCLAAHEETVAFGVQSAEVWIETEGGQHG